MKKHYFAQIYDTELIYTNIVHSDHYCALLLMIIIRYIQQSEVCYLLCRAAAEIVSILCGN